MLTELLDYELPDELIARRPLAERDGGRLLVLDRGEIHHRWVRELPELLPAGALLVLNDTKVRRARIHGVRRESGGKVELLLLGRDVERERPPAEPGEPGQGEVWEVLARSSKPLRSGALIDAGRLGFEVLERRDDGRLLVRIRASASVEEILAEEGRVPIPPYLGRADDPDDLIRYQTVYARRVGSVAAPTAGLHLTQELMAAVRARGATVACLELEVGLGTFRPIVTHDLESHEMHEERFVVDSELVTQIAQARADGRKVVAVGTTVVRALESAASPTQPGHVEARSGSTRLLIQPGYSFQVVDALLTNFHQPRSTLLALVAAFAGLAEMHQAYSHAVAANYRFLSFGDAMWLPRRRA